MFTIRKKQNIYKKTFYLAKKQTKKIKIYWKDFKEANYLQSLTILLHNICMF